MTARYLPSSMSSLEEEDVLLRVPRRDRGSTFLSPIREVHKASDQVLPSVGCEVDPAALQRAFAAPERVLADRVEDDVVRLAVLGEVVLGVVDDLSAPSDRTVSTFLVLHTAVTSASKYLASCTAAVPMDPDAP